MKNKKTFTVGQRVACAYDDNEGHFTDEIVYGEYATGFVFGEITDIVSPSKVEVLWDNDWLNEVVYDTKTGNALETGNSITMDVELLLTEDEGKKKLSVLEKEFNKASKEVKAKMVEAGKLIREANKISKTRAGCPLEEMYSAVSPLLKAMDECGWNSSSFNC